jgi:putative phage-type endonuclease
MLTDKQLALRKGGITATDIAAICGSHPYKSAINVFLEKRDQALPFVENERVRWGNLLEPVIRADYLTRHPEFAEVREVGTLVKLGCSWAMATPDGIVMKPGKSAGTNIFPSHGLEIKTHSIRMAHLYGAPGSDEVPAHELVQCVWNMHVTGLSRWDLVSFIDGQPTDYVIERDDDLIDALVGHAEAFRAALDAGEPPDPDGTEQFAAYLSTRYPQSKLAMREATEDEVTAATALRVVRQTVAGLEEVRAKLEQRLKLSIGDAAGISFKDEDGKPQTITWKTTADRSRVDWERLARSLAYDLDQKLEDYFLEAFTTTVTPGPRMFCVPRTWTKKEN